MGILRPNIQGFQGKADLPWVSRGLRRGESVADGQQVEIPVLQYNRTVGTREESRAGNGKPGASEVGVAVGKSALQWEDVMRSEIK